MGSLAQITGLGYAGLTRSGSLSCEALAVQAMEEAVTDAGLRLHEVDGLLISRSGNASEPSLSLFAHSGLPNLALLQYVDCEGTSAIQMVLTASLAVRAGLARHVLCVFADTPLAGGIRGRVAFTKTKSVTGVDSLRYTAGAHGGVANYALAAQRYLHDHGLDHRTLGAVAVSTRAWACLHPQAVMREPLTMDDYLASRFIVDPLRLFDCALPVNGAIALVVAHADQAAYGQHPPVHVHAVEQTHTGASNAFAAWQRPAVTATARRLFERTKLKPIDVDVRQFYDAFTIMTLQLLEDYGFCLPGQAGALAASGALGPGGSMPTNTGGGHLSSFYMQGMTPVAEAITQARGAAGERQCPRHDIVLATNEGGWFDYHAGMLLSRHARLR